MTSRTSDPDATTRSDMPREESLGALRAALGERLLTDPEALGAYTHDESLARPDGLPAAVVLAESTEDVSAALAWANEHGVPVSVRGAGSGLAGGCVAYPGGLVVSTERMNRILALDPVDRLAEVEPGVITQDLDRAAHEHGLFFPPDPASSDWSTVGGNIATNAGGLRCIAHGVTADSVAGLEVVLADGSVVHTGARTIKNVTGLDLTRLFIGSEGTLGVITRATVRLKPVPAGTPWSFLASFDDIEAAGRAVGAVVTSPTRPETLELVDALSARFVEDYRPSGMPVPEAALLLGQTVGPAAEEVARAVVQIMREHGATTAEAQPGEGLMEARRLVAPASDAAGLRVLGDVGVPVSKLPDAVRGIQEISRRTGRRVAVVAHAGDGNLHPCVDSGPENSEWDEAERTLDAITEMALGLGGVITGEHGIGKLKHHELPLQFDDATLRAQRAIKQALDPRGTLSPGRAI